MSSYCLKCRKNTESKGPRLSKTINGKSYYCPCVQCVAIKNPNSSKSKKRLNC